MYQITNRDALQKKANNKDDPRYVFYEALLRSSSHEEYIQCLGGNVVVQPEAFRRPVTALAEYRYVSQVRGWIMEKGESAQDAPHEPGNDEGEGMYWPEHKIELSPSPDGRGVLVTDHKVCEPNCYVARGWDLEIHEDLICTFVEGCLQRGFCYALAQNHPGEAKRGKDSKGKDGEGVNYLAFGRGYFLPNGERTAWDIAIDQTTRGRNGSFVLPSKHVAALERAGLTKDFDPNVQPGRYWIETGGDHFPRINPDDFVKVLEAINKVGDGIADDLGEMENDYSHVHGSTDELGNTLVEDLDEINNQEGVEKTERETLVQARIGQGRYRVELLRMWENCCAVTGCSETRVLRASHAQPWQDSDNRQRLDPNNGLPLIATLDALFDAGLISFNSEGKMLISDSLPPDQREILGVANENETGLRRGLTESQEIYMAFHRERYFPGN